jgi:Ca2+-binding RTX toxin-like protein
MVDIWGTSGNDTRFGTSGNDNIYGLGGNDKLYGLGGNDVIDGGIGDDTMAGGVGDDTYYVDSFLDVVIEQANEGAADHVKASINHQLATNVEKLTLLGGADLNGWGNGGDNTVLGNTGNNSLYGLGGSDILKGGGGNDTLDGGTGADIMVGGIGDDKYYIDQPADQLIENAGEGYDYVYTSFSYTLTDNFESLTLLEGAGAINGTGNGLDNWVNGNSSANILHGAAGKDTLDGGGGIDTMYGGVGDDRYTVDESGADIVIEYAGEGIDTVHTYANYTLPDHVEKLILVGVASAISGAGNSLDNTITGNHFDNTLTGGAGNDHLIGGGGPDTLIGGIGNDGYTTDFAGDVLIELAGEGKDTVFASFNYTLGANLEVLYLVPGAGALNGTGNALDNEITGNESSNVLSGGGGKDYLNGSGGIDFMFGGAGDDAYVVDSASDQVSEAAGEGFDEVRAHVSFTLGANVEWLRLLAGAGAINGTGNELDNVIDGNESDNVLTGHGGADQLNGGAGKDTMIGGTGDDRYWVDQADDSVIETADGGLDEVYASFNYTLGANLEGLRLLEGAATNGTGNGDDNSIVGNSNNNTLTGGDGNDVLDGWTGADTMIGGIGNDYYIVDNMSDVVVEAADQGIDTVGSRLSTTVLAAGVDNLSMLADAGAATGTGNGLNNVLTGNESGNVLIGLGGSDNLNGNGGNDTLEGGEGTDTLYGGTGTDTLSYAGSASQVLINLGNGLAMGGDAEGDVYDEVENVVGSAHADGLFGNGLVNTLTGGAGDDYLWGGFNADTFAFAAGFGQDTIGDWQSEDTIQFSGVFASFAAVQAAMQQVGADTVITLDAANTITLENVAAVSLTSADFLFV